MSKCPGLHCDGCGSGPGLPAGIILACIVLAAAGGAIERAANDAVTILVIAVIVAGSLAAAILLTAGTVLFLRARAHARGRVTARPCSASLRRSGTAPRTVLVWQPARPAQRVLQPRVSSRALPAPRSRLDSQAERILYADTPANHPDA